MAEEGKIPGLPDEGRLFNLSQFKGLNTQSPRMAIEDQEMSWCENFFPIAPGNLRSMFGIGSSIYTAPGGKSVKYFFFYNIGSTQYSAVFLSDGTAYQINVATHASTTISATANKFYTGSTLPTANQYGNQYLLIANTNTVNDYWIWDGALLYGAGTISPIIVVTAGGSGYTTGATAAVSGGSGSGATLAVTVVGGIVTSIAVTNPGTGYVAGDTITITISPVGAGSGATATGVIMPFGNSGNSIETFLNRVFLSNKAKIQITDPGSLTAFNTVITSSDSFLKNQFSALKQTNGFIYMFADSSVNDISNVQTSGSPAITTLNNSNADPQVGTPWRDSVVTFGRDIIFANTNGIYVMYGGAAEKVSDELNGIFATATLPITGNAYPSAAFATVFGIKIYMILLTIVDIVTGNLTPKLLCWDGKKWFIASQEVNFTFIGSQEVSSQLTAWGTDGTKIYPLFQQASDTLTKLGQSKQWSGQSYIIDKQILGVYLQAYDNSGEGFSISFTIDTDVATTSPIVLNSQGFLTFVGTGGAIQFINGSSNPINFTVRSASIAGNDVSNYGKIAGTTFTSTSLDFNIVDVSLLYKNQRFMR